MKYEIQQMLTRRRRDREQFINEWSRCASGISPYVASKHAVMGLTRSAALDYTGAFGSMLSIRVRATDLMARSAEMGITLMISDLWFQWVGSVRQRKLLKRLCFCSVLATLRDNP